MSPFRSSSSKVTQARTKGRLDALNRSQAVIEFELDGTILSANENFLQVLGYSAEEIVGRHHTMFVAEDERGGQAYRELWNGLNRGEFRAGEFRRVAKGGVEIWIHGSYNPVLDAQGKPVRVVKFASDITAAKRLSADHGGQVAAIGRSQAVIAFTLEGIIEEANDNFLETLGYELSEIKGRHHSIFVDPVDRESAGYADFWRRLGAGEFFSAEFKRVARDGREVWIQASYNPILDPAGRPVRVVKFATDVTAAKLQSADNAGQLAAISKSQAVIEFELDGTIRTANANFTDAVGYRLQDIQGRHHRMFVDPAEREGDAYRAFWAALAAGEYQAGEYRRLGADGREIWLQASYNPILGLDGRPMKVVKYATDITAQVRRRERSESIRAMMEDVAAGAEELNASVREIADNMGRSRARADEAFERVVAAGSHVDQLNHTAESMTGIVRLIANISSQINLLALNATIEAARAGESGRGFAVVAHEVKTLAAQTKTATDEVAREIEGLRAVSTEVSHGLGGVRESIDTVREYVTTTAAAVEEQSAVATEMSVNMNAAAQQAAAA